LALAALSLTPATLLRAPFRPFASVALFFLAAAPSERKNKPTPAEGKKQ